MKKLKVRTDNGTVVEGELEPGLYAAAIAYIDARVECLRTAKPFGTSTASAAPTTTIDYGAMLGAHGQALDAERKAWSELSLAVLRELGDLP